MHLNFFTVVANNGEILSPFLPNTLKFFYRFRRQSSSSFAVFADYGEILSPFSPNTLTKRKIRIYKIAYSTFSTNFKGAVDEDLSMMGYKLT